MSRSARELAPKTESSGYFDEDQVKRDMQTIYSRFTTERARLRNAYVEFMKVESTVHLAMKFKEPALLSNEKAKAYLVQAKAENMKLTLEDIEQLIAMECGPIKTEYALAKFDLETSDKAYSKLEAQLSYLQSEMKLR